MDAYEDRVLNALAATLDAIDGLNQSGYMLSSPVAPIAEVLPGVIQFDETFGRGMDRYECVVRVTVGTAMDIGAQKKLRQFRAPSGPSSVKEAIEVDPTLGGLVSDVHVNRCSPARNFRRVDGVVVFGCDFECEFEGPGNVE